MRHEALLVQPWTQLLAAHDRVPLARALGEAPVRLSPRITKEAARRLVAGARVGRLATVDPDGRPNVVPFVFAVDGDTLYSSVDDKPKGSGELRRVRNLRERAEATILVDRYEERWPELWWVRLRGRGRVLEEGAERDRALGMLRAKYPQYREMPPRGPVIAVDVDDWRGWSWRPIQYPP